MVNQNELLVWAEIRGESRLVGSIRAGEGGAEFTYGEKFLESGDAAALSISLPLRKEPFGASETKNFFDGLLPEGFTRKSVAKWMHADSGDYLSILEGLGSECLGAIRITPARIKEEEPHYEKLSDEQVIALAREGATTSAQIVTKAHLSLTGASGKVGLYYHGSDDTWFLPTGTAASTHIVKQSHVRLNQIVANEQLTLMTAKRCGLDVPESFIVSCGTDNEEEVLFATKRYDRSISGDSRRVDGLALPSRLHQEDFAQALGMPAAQKYEQEPQGYLHKIFDLLRRCSSDPVRDQLRLWDALVFNYLTGNTDAHLKNYSLLYSEDLKSVRLAPFYDMLSTAVYDSCTRDMSFYIGDECSLDEISRESFRAAASMAGLGVKMAMRRFDAMADQFENALREAAEELAGLGFSNVWEIREKILARGGAAAIR